MQINSKQNRQVTCIAFSWRTFGLTFRNKKRIIVGIMFKTVSNEAAFSLSNYLNL